MSAFGAIANCSRLGQLVLVLRKAPGSPNEAGPAAMGMLISRQRAADKPAARGDARAKLKGLGPMTYWRQNTFHSRPWTSFASTAIGNVMNGPVAWIAVDWGTSNLRAWAIDDEGRTIANAASEAGMARLSRDAFEPTLLSVIDGWLASGKTRVLACGMVGARQGWMEAPYASVPCTPVTQTIAPECRDPRLEMHILAGIRQLHPPDVMRGEETQIAGVLLRQPGFEGVICLPGTHTKWAEIAGGIITRFRTFMTGESCVWRLRSDWLWDYP